MDKVTILSRDKFLDFTPSFPKEDVVAIRIGDSAPVADSANKQYFDVLALSFYDIAEYADKIDKGSPIGSNRVTAATRSTINTFVDKYADEHFVVHCDQGKSRSAAVGFYILKRLGFNDELNQKKESLAFSPNVEVYGMLIGKPYTKATAHELRSELRDTSKQ